MTSWAGVEPDTEGITSIEDAYNVVCTSVTTDSDNDGEVKGSDFLILKSNWYQAVPADCQPDGTWPPQP